VEQTKAPQKGRLTDLFSIERLERRMTTNERTWRPKMGDKVMVTGLIGIEGPSVVTATPPQLEADWYWIENYSRAVHIRNLDPVYEDERKNGSLGLGRMMKVGDEVYKATSVKSRITAIKTNGVIVSTPIGGEDVYYTLVERRIKDEGRKARKVTQPSTLQLRGKWSGVGSKMTGGIV
jgi:hypothetical protein